MNNLQVVEKGLIPVYENEQKERVIDGRALHMFLESKREFATWIKDKLQKYGFVENEDFSTVDKFVKREGSSLGSKVVDYILKLDTAKEIAMVENNEKGRQIRKYFIEVEKKYKLDKNQKSQNSLTLEEVERVSRQMVELSKAAGAEPRYQYELAKSLYSRIGIEMPALPQPKSTFTPNHLEPVCKVPLAPTGLDGWIKEIYVVGGGSTKLDTIHASYLKWCSDILVKPATKTAVFEALKKTGCTHRTQKGKMFVNVKRKK